MMCLAVALAERGNILVQLPTFRRNVSPLSARCLPCSDRWKMG